MIATKTERKKKTDAIIITLYYANVIKVKSTVEDTKCREKKLSLGGKVSCRHYRIHKLKREGFNFLTSPMSTHVINI